MLGTNLLILSGHTARGLKHLILIPSYRFHHHRFRLIVTDASRTTSLLYNQQEKLCHSTSTGPMTSAIESAKRRAAQRAVAEHFSPAFSHVGIGSGSTIKYVVDAIAEAVEAQSSPCNIRFVPTGYQSRSVVLEAGLTSLPFDHLPDDVILDVAFDGADEVDDDLNCIKGGGACLFQEKLVATRAKKFVCVADYRKAQPRLLTSWPSIPIEVAPIAAPVVLIALQSLGSKNPKIRLNPLAKSGPLKTDQDFYIIDAPFPNALLTQADVTAKKGLGTGQDGTWEVGQLAVMIRAITGVLEVGLFYGYDGIEAQQRNLKGGGQKPVAIYFGMEDGSVQVRLRKET